MFLIPLDDRREWYRYHPLFQQFLLAQLQIREPQNREGFHHKAGRWLEHNGYLPEAVGHYLSACRHEEALRLIVTLAPDMLTDGWSTLGNWLSLIPEPLLIAKPRLLLTQLAALYLSGQTGAATDGYWRAVRRLENGGPTNQSEKHRLLKAGLAFLAAMRTFLDGDFLDAVHFSKTYVEAHPEGDLFVGFGSDRDGYHPLWNVYVSDSSLRMAEEVLPPLLAIWSATKNIYMIAHLNIDYGKWLYERNRLDEAESCMRRAWELGNAHDHVSLVTLASLWLARISVARGDAKTAQGMVNRINRQTAREASALLSGKVAWFSAMQGRLPGQERPVKAWLRKSDLRPGDEISLSMIKEYNLLACCLAEQGKVREAVVLLDRLLRMADEAGKQSDKIRLLVHKSVVLSGQGKLSQSMDALDEALALAWPEGYVRTFVDEGLPLRTLLEQ